MSEKETFIRSYRELILVHFDYKKFLHDGGVQVRHGVRPLRDFFDFYTPWHHADGKLTPSFEHALNDSCYTAATVREALALEEKVPAIQERSRNLPRRLWPVPIATDTKLHATVLLDSNKTICALAHVRENPERMIPVIEVYGEHMETLNSDFRILARMLRA